MKQAPDDGTQRERYPDSGWTRFWRGGRRVYADADWLEVAGESWADTAFDVPFTDDAHAKQGRATGRYVAQREGRTVAVYLKRHHRIAWWRGLMTTIWPTGDWSPAMGERRNLLRVQSQGLFAPRVVAAAEYLEPRGRLRSVLAVEVLHGMIELHKAIEAAERSKSPAEFSRWKASLIPELARIARALHDQTTYHKDLYLCHFFVDARDIETTPADWRGRVAIIDLHRLGRHRLTWPWWVVKDLAQMLFSSFQAGVTARDRLRFWREYKRGAALPSLHGLLAWAVRLKGDRYRNHNEKCQASTQSAPADAGGAHAARSASDDVRKCA